MPYKWKHIAPTTGLLDVRSCPDMVQLGSWRRRDNWISSDKNSLKRMPGWSKAFDGDTTPYNNADLHDQLLALDDSGGPQREIPLFLQEFNGTTNNRKLVCGTLSRLYCLNQRSGNWAIIADGLGGGLNERRRWQSAQVLDTVIFSNNYNELISWNIGQQSTDLMPDATSTIESLSVDTGIALTRAAVLYAWKGVVFMGDVVMDGARYAHRVVWSDFNAPLDWDPGKDGTIAGYQDLAFGERVLAFRELGDYLLCYTNKAIWQIAAVGGDEVWNFRSTYSDYKSGEGCLAYRHTLCNVGDAHIFAGKDGIYLYNLTYQKPEQPEWLYVATKEMFDNIDPDKCELHNAGYQPVTKHYWLSWASLDDDLPAKTFIADMRHLVSAEVDAGFISFANYTSDITMSLRDWLLSICACSVTEMNALGIGYLKEGLPRIDANTICDITPASIYTSEGFEIDGYTIENYLKDSPDADSLCAVMAANGIEQIDDLCSGCVEDDVFLGISASDYCIKEIGDVYARDICSNPTAEGSTGTNGYTASVGQYTSGGYYSRLMTGAILVDGAIRGVELEMQAEAQASPPEIKLTVGVSGHAVDPRTENCAILWRPQVINKHYLACQSETTSAQHLAAGTRPANRIYWPLHIVGKFIYLDFLVQNSSGTAPTGGVARISRISVAY